MNEHRYFAGRELRQSELVSSTQNGLTVILYRGMTRRFVLLRERLQITIQRPGQPVHGPGEFFEALEFHF